MFTDQGEVLLSIARKAIAEAFGKELEWDESASWLREHGATFVTLTQQGELRGCIGTLEAHRPLVTDVKSNALAAAFRDPRFPALSAAELETTRVEVSLLSPSEPISFESEEHALSQLRPGIDGIILEYRHYRSTFLPQVWEQLPDKTEFMAHLKYKAGLSPTFWADDLQLQRYTVSKWKEAELEKDAI